MTIDFEELLAILVLLIFAFSLYLIYKSNKAWKEKGSKEFQIKCSSRFESLLFYIHYFLILLILIVAVYSTWLGFRSAIYFASFALVFISSVLLILVRPIEKIRCTIIFTLITLSLIHSLIPIAENRGIIFGPDQWRDFVATKSIYEEGNFWNASVISGSYYSFIPLFDILNASISLITGNTSFLSFIVLVATLSVIMVLSIYLILLKLTGTHIASVIGVFAFLSTPRLSVVGAISSTISITLGSLLILMLIQYVSTPCRHRLIVIVILALSTVIFHPTGIIGLLALCGGLIVMGSVGIIRKVYPESMMMSRLFVLVSAMSLAYWTLSNVVFASIIVPLRRLFVSLPTYWGESIYTPRYYTGGFEVYAYAWALPVGISAAYVFTIFMGHLPTKRKGHVPKQKKFNSFVFIAGIVSLLMIGIGFVSILHAPSASLERYINMPAYLLALIPLGMVGAHIINSKQKLGFLCLMLLLSTFVYIGTSSPDWAPFEHSEFSAVCTTYFGYTEAKTIATFLPNNLYIYSDNDIPVEGVARIANISFEAPESFQTTRSVLDHLKNGAFIPLSSNYERSVFIIKFAEIENITLFNSVNVLYNSGKHVMIKNP
jgi:hypothetical protein